MTRLSNAVLAALAVAVIAGAWFTWRQRQAPQAPLPAPAPAPAVAPVVPPAPAASAAPAIQHPLEAASEPAPQPQAALQPEGVADALAGLVGSKAVASFFLTDDFAHRLVATVDNLGRAHAPSRLWPVQPTPERLRVLGEGSQQTIDPDNGLRYAPFVLLAETVDMRQAAALYRRMYPMLQQAYQELGYPNGYFNDRMVAVIDLLLATPEPAGPLQVQLPRIEGPLQPARPWVLYQFADPALESLAAGQKVLLRMGPVNERRLKARLREFRNLIARPASAG